MKVNLKFITFCLIAVLLVLSYRKAMHGAQTVVSAVQGWPPTALLLSSLKPTPPVIGTTYSLATLYSIIQKSKSTTSDFIVTNAAGTQVVPGGANRALPQNWQTNMQNPNAILLHQGDFINKNSIPNFMPGTNKLNLQKYGYPSVSTGVAKFITWFTANYPRVMLYFNYPSDTNPQYRLYITDPNPGNVVLLGGKLLIVPAYINVLSKWNLN